MHCQFHNSYGGVKLEINEILPTLQIFHTLLTFVVVVLTLCIIHINVPGTGIFPISILHPFARFNSFYKILVRINQV